jgi:carbon storage regulator CsrA
MLILDAKEGENIWVGDMKLMVLHVSPTKVKLGFIGPKEIRVMRESIMTEEQRNAKVK